MSQVIHDLFLLTNLVKEFPIIDNHFQSISYNVTITDMVLRAFYYIYFTKLWYNELNLKFNIKGDEYETNKSRGSMDI
jgi:hypothetical protein